MQGSTLQSVALLVARVTLGIIFFAHGAQKVFGWFGGYGISGTYGYFQSIGAPAVLAMAGVFVELIAAVLMFLGASTGLAALLIIIQMLAAILLLHGASGFFMNYYAWLPAGQEGYEFNIVLIGMALVLLLAGPGRYSVDAVKNLDFVRRALGFRS